MFDLVSTTQGADQQSIRCARLLAAVIAKAIEDASMKVSEQEARTHKPTGDAAAAIHWLFGKNSCFDLYAQLIGANPHTIREALLSDRRIVYPVIRKPRVEKELEPQTKRYTEFDRRNLHARHRWLYG